jgi:hypothetical protein
METRKQNFSAHASPLHALNGESEVGGYAAAAVHYNRLEYLEERSATLEA